VELDEPLGRLAFSQRDLERHFVDFVLELRIDLDEFAGRLQLLVFRQVLERGHCVIVEQVLEEEEQVAIAV